MTTALMPTGTRSGIALPDLLDRLFGSTYTPSFGIDGAYRGLPTNVYEVGDTFQVAMLLPGADPDSIQVTALGNTMTVAGSMQLAQPEGGRFVWQEFSQGPTQFRREITLPTEVDPAKIEARYQNGVLTMIAPKAEHAMPRQIKVKI
ncbi:MAG: Hsp20/alpha crystallin family protein [Chloroflexi bacterium]|nr:MAG: Hsp20/alpha crystallin family protein [Chloroflexota bacterium]